jgi:hypothetical protein
MGKNQEILTNFAAIAILVAKFSSKKFINFIIITFTSYLLVKISEIIPLNKT